MTLQLRIFCLILFSYLGPKYTYGQEPPTVLSLQEQNSLDQLVAQFSNISIDAFDMDQAVPTSETAGSAPTEENLEEFLDVCVTTERGCSCKQEWSLNGQLLSGCDNPDSDPLGLWCVVESDSCQDMPMNAEALQEPFDYCIEGCPVGSGFNTQQANDTEQIAQGIPQIEVFPSPQQIFVEPVSVESSQLQISIPPVVEIVEQQIFPEPALAEAPQIQIRIPPVVEIVDQTTLTEPVSDVLTQVQISVPPVQEAQGQQNSPEPIHISPVPEEEEEEEEELPFLSISSPLPLITPESPTPTVEEVPLIPQECGTTQLGCKCRENWTIASEPQNMFQGCDNPDQDPLGLWCHVDESTCSDGPLPSVGIGIEQFDYCKEGCPIGSAAAISGMGATEEEDGEPEEEPSSEPIFIEVQNTDNNVPVVEPQSEDLSPVVETLPTTTIDEATEPELPDVVDPCSTTRSGCVCLPNWNFRGETFQGCSNPDSDPLGLWCNVDPDSCESPPGVPTGESPYDYCKSQCPLGSAAPPGSDVTTDARTVEVSLSVVEEPIEDALDCSRTLAGCECEETWSFGMKSFIGCANPDLDNQGPWCQIVLGTCTGEAQGGELTPPFDYCDERCTEETLVEEETDCSITQKGCACMEEWNFRGEVIQGCGNPDADSQGFWCVVQETTRTCPDGIPFNLESQGQVIDQYFDYCQSGCGDTTTPQVSSLDDEDCTITVQGCQCQPEWTFDNVIYSGCANPDNYDSGNWCEVLVNTCDVDISSLDPIYEENIIMAYADTCKPGCSETADPIILQPNPPPPSPVSPPPPSPSPLPLGSPPPPPPLSANQSSLVFTGQSSSAPSTLATGEGGCSSQTVGGCMCRSSWLYEIDQQEGCQNPDGDPEGNWCIVDPEVSCTVYGPIRDADQNIIDYFDYCIPECEQFGQTPPPDTYVPCTTTQAGCDCMEEWMYDGNSDGLRMAYFGCANTEDDVTGPWCSVISSATCASIPRSSIIEDSQAWDYCEPQCSPPTTGSCTVTRSGCNCLPEWSYDGISQTGCTQPDADSQFSWCVVDVTCTSASGNLPGTGESWDACPEDC